MTTAWIALGSNQGNSLQHLQDALAAMAMLPGSTLVAASSFYRSSPIGPQDQPDYLNAVARLDTAMPPEELLRQLQAIEQEHGRDRSGERWGARTLDLDILLYGQQQYHARELLIPHPAMTERAFVLYPLQELAPGIDIPGHGNIEQLLPAVAAQKIEILYPRHAN